MKTIAFFNSRGGVGTTSLVYHLAWMYAELGLSVIAADLDPQASLTSMFLDDDQLATLWPDRSHPKTIFGASQPLLEETDDIPLSYVAHVADKIGLLVGDLELSTSEDELAAQWREMTRIPAVYREAVLNEAAGVTVDVKNDPRCLASLKQYRSLMSLAEEARKPMFFLKPSDGALGGHAKAVQECYKDFRELAQTIADRCGAPIP